MDIIKIYRGGGEVIFEKEYGNIHSEDNKVNTCP